MIDNFCYRKVGREITKLGAIMKIEHFDRVQKFFLHIGGTNNNFADIKCIK